MNFTNDEFSMAARYRRLRKTFFSGVILIPFISLVTALLWWLVAQAFFNATSSYSWFWKWSTIILEIAFLFLAGVDVLGKVFVTWHVMKKYGKYGLPRYAVGHVVHLRSEIAKREKRFPSLPHSEEAFIEMIKGKNWPAICGKTPKK